MQIAFFVAAGTSCMWVAAVR